MWNDSEQNVLVLGHRGIKTFYPENTMVSFKAALDARVDLIEMDLHLTKDKHLVVIHDAKLDRTTNGTGNVCDYTLEELKQLDAGSFMSPKFKGERIPSFAEFLDLIKEADYEVLLNVEIKSYTPETADKTVQMLEKYDLLERSVIASFDAAILRYIHATYPSVKLQGFPGRYLKNFTEDTYDCMYGMGIPGYWQNWSKTDAESLKEDVAFAKSRGIKPWLFCADTEEHVIECVKYGTFNVTCNNPFPALNYLPKVNLHKPIYPNEPIVGRMKVANLHAAGNLVTEEIDIPSCQDDEVLVNIKNCGICGSDIGRIRNYGTYHFPTVPGHEFAGKVVYDPKNEWLGKRVAVFPLLPCFECERCKAEKYVQCENYDYYGSRRDGAFAEYIAVKRFNLVELPENVTYDEGAMCEPTAVALHGIKKVRIQEGNAILITGAGPIGLLAGMWAKHFGAAKVMFLDIDDKKIEFAKQFGFDAFVEGEKVDCALEGTGASSALTAIINSIKPMGHVVLMGNPGGDMQLNSKIYQSILRKELEITGTWNSSYKADEDEWKESLMAISSGSVLPKALISHRIKIDELSDMIEQMYARKEFYCKVMVENDG